MAVSESIAGRASFVLSGAGGLAAETRGGGTEMRSQCAWPLDTLGSKHVAA